MRVLLWTHLLSACALRNTNIGMSCQASDHERLKWHSMYKFSPSKKTRKAIAGEETEGGETLTTMVIAKSLALVVVDDSPTTLTAALPV